MLCRVGWNCPSILHFLEIDDFIKGKGKEEADLSKIANGDAPDAQKLRTLENNLDKATLKIQEAVHIGQAYQSIIHKLQQVSSCDIFHYIFEYLER